MFSQIWLHFQWHYFKCSWCVWYIIHKSLCYNANVTVDDAVIFDIMRSGWRLWRRFLEKPNKCQPHCYAIGDVAWRFLFKRNFFIMCASYYYYYYSRTYNIKLYELCIKVPRNVNYEVILMCAAEKAWTEAFLHANEKRLYRHMELERRAVCLVNPSDCIV